MGIGYKSLFDRTDIENRIRSKPITDAEGLDRAYDSSGSIFASGEVGYIAGTKGGFLDNDWLQNYKRIGFPFITGNKVHVEQTDRYKQARVFFAKHPEGKTLVGHSLGGAVALELKKDNPDLTGRIYGTPHYDPLDVDKIKDLFNETRKARDDYYKDKLFVEKAVNWVYDREQDLFENLTGLDQYKGTDGVEEV